MMSLILLFLSTIVFEAKTRFIKGGGKIYNRNKESQRIYNTNRKLLQLNDNNIDYDALNIFEQYLLNLTEIDYYDVEWDINSWTCFNDSLKEVQSQEVENHYKLYDNLIIHIYLK